MAPATSNREWYVVLTPSSLKDAETESSMSDSLTVAVGLSKAQSPPGRLGTFVFCSSCGLGLRYRLDFAQLSCKLVHKNHIKTSDALNYSSLSASRSRRSSLLANWRSGMRKAIGLVVLFLCSALPSAQSPASVPRGEDSDTHIPAGSRLYIAPIEGGYDIYLAAAMHKKEVPIILVTDKTKADFELSGVTETERAGWAKTVFLMSTATNEQASIKIVNLKSGTIVFGYNVNKYNSARGKQSSSEACAKHLKEKIEAR